MQIRLDTQDILDKIEAFLKGEKVVLIETEHGLHQQKVPTGDAKLNDRGIQSIMSWLTSILNPACVQGNFDSDLYYTYIQKFLKSLGYNLVLNCKRWNLADHDIELVFDEIKTTIVPFFSRLLGNKERESYTQTFHTKEHSVIQQDLGKGGGMLR